MSETSDGAQPGAGPGTSNSTGGGGTDPTGTSTAGTSAPSDGVRRVTAEVVAPVLRHRVDPDYPSLARRIGLEGKVVLECIVDADGSVRVVRVLKGDPLLVPAARDAVEQWAYDPARFEGHPQSVWLNVSIEFSMN